MFLKVVNFIRSLFLHTYHGFPKANKKQIDNRYQICLSCDQYDKNNEQCLVCGCNINNKAIFMNKLAWADQECPLKKWTKI